MKKILLYIPIISTVFTGVLIPVHQAEAIWMFAPFLAKAAWWAGATAVSGAVAWVFSDGVVEIAVKIVLWFLDFLRVIAAQLLTTAMFLFDFVVDKTIINSNLGSIDAINIGWTLTRDLVNIFFIFILLYIAIATILNIGNYKKTLVTLVIVALTVNFSLFATKIVIDASNIVAIGLYNNMELNSNSLADTFAGSGLKIQKVFERKNEANAPEDNVAEAQYLFGSILLLATTAWVLFNIVFLLVGRFIAFIFLMVLSPLAFVSFILPGLKSKIFDKWWSTLVNQAVVAPVFFFLFYIVAKIIEQDPFSSYSAAEDPNEVGILFNFVVLIGLMIYALSITKNVSGSIGASATSWGKKATGFVAGGAVGFAGRRVVGRAARGITESARMKQWAARSRIGRAAFQTLDTTAGASFDVRAVAPGAGLGKAGGKGGYRARLEKQVKSRVEMGKRVEAGKYGETLLATDWKGKPVQQKERYVDKKTGEVKTKMVTMTTREQYTRELEREKKVLFGFKKQGYMQATKDRMAGMSLRKKETDLDKLLKGIKDNQSQVNPPKNNPEQK